jgi:hypothetical protein
MRTRIYAVAALMPILAAAAGAQPVGLSPAALHERPALVAVDPENVTVVQFCNAIAWSAYKASWLHATVSPQDKRVLLLDASAASGQVALMVWADGDGTPMQFTIRASAHALANHVYFVGCADATSGTAAPPVAARSAGLAAPGRAPRSAPPRTPARSAPAPDQAAAWDAFVAMLSPRQWELLTDLVTSPTESTYAGFLAASSPDQRSAWRKLALAETLAPRTAAGRSARPVPEPLEGPPPWLSWEAAGKSGEGAVLVTYTVTNTGSNPVVMDVARLEVLDDRGTRVPQKAVSREDTSGVQGRILPGGIESGVIYVLDPPEGGIVIRWPTVELHTGLTYVLAQIIQ